MKKILYISIAALAFAACSNNDNNTANSSNDSSAVSKDSIIDPGTDPGVVMFKVTGEDALRLVSEVKEIEAELKRTYPDTAVRNTLLLMQEANPDDPRHYVQLMEMHSEGGVALMHFSVDARSGEIKVMDPLAEEETWITLDQWRRLKI